MAKVAGVEFKNELSWADVIALAGAAAICFVVFFDVKEDVNVNKSAIAHVEEEVQEVYKDLSSEISRLDKEARTDRKEILNAINDTRVEAAAGRNRIEAQLDRLIERIQ